MRVWARVDRASRLTTMLYVGVNAEINGYVRFDARAATSSGATPPR